MKSDPSILPLIVLAVPFILTYYIWRVIRGALRRLIADAIRDAKR